MLYCDGGVWWGYTGVTQFNWLAKFSIGNQHKGYSNLHPYFLPHPLSSPPSHFLPFLSFSTSPWCELCSIQLRCINMRWYWTPLCPFPSPTWFLFEFTPYYDFSLIRFPWDWIDNVIVHRFDCGVFCVGRCCGVEWVVLLNPDIQLRKWKFNSPPILITFLPHCVGIGLILPFHVGSIVLCIGLRWCWYGLDRFCPPLGFILELLGCSLYHLGVIVVLFGLSYCWWLNWLRDMRWSEL